ALLIVILVLATRRGRGPVRDVATRPPRTYSAGPPASAAPAPTAPPAKPVTSDLRLDIVEGPGAGRQVALIGTVAIGRDPGSQLVLDDTLVSRRHARVSRDA